MKREDISPIEKLNELRLDASNPLSKGKVFVLLEGKDDDKLFGKLLGAHCKIEWVPGGKVQLQNVLQTLLDAHLVCFIIGIRDADFLHLEGKTSGLPELFLTDFHDLEMMMLTEDECFEAILAEFSPQDRENINLFRQKVLESLIFVSYLRWWNDINVAELKFKAATLGDCFDINQWRLEKGKYLQKLVQASANAIEKDIHILEKAAESLKNEEYDLLQLCNGHDVMEILALYFTKQSTQRGITAQRVASQFRTAYSKPAFYKTKLYANLQKWAVENHTTI